MIDDDLRAALDWLETACEPDDFYGEAEDAKHRATIQRRLDQLVCPEGKDVPGDVVQAMVEAFWDAPGSYVEGMRAAIDTLRAHLTAPPKPGKVEAWGVLWPDRHISVHADKAQAMRNIEGNSRARVVRLVEADDADQAP